MVLFRLYTFSRNPTEMILCQEEHDIDIVTDVNFGHLLNVVSARFLHSKVTIFFYCSKYSMGKYFETV